MNEEPQSSHSSQMKAVVTVVAIVIILGVGTAFFLVFKSKNVFTGNTNNAVTKTYTSEKLGITFKYAREDLEKRILVKEVGNTVYVYYEGTDPSSGQYVRVFNKDSKQSLQQAVENQFLKGYNSVDCFVKSGTDINGTQPSSGVAAVIAFPISTDTNSDGLENRTKCPQDYSLFNGISYFWTDREDSTKFVFFSIGQYYIPAESVGTSWHTTLEFIQ